MTVDVESLEHAVLAAVPPQAVQEFEGWLLALDDGTVGRAHSAVPTRHQRVPMETVPRIEAAYGGQGLQAAFRVPQAESFDGLRALLAARGYTARQPTLTLVGTAAAMAGLGDPAGVELAPAPGDEWASVFLGEGFDAVDGASRLRILRRATQSVFALLRVDGRAVAVGLACFSRGWCGIHAMRTAPNARGRGLASNVLAALAAQAQRRGISRAFLQVEQGNAPARALYQRAGFEAAWVYEYWRR